MGTSVARHTGDMLRISRATTADDEGPVLLRLEGQVVGPWVKELRRTCLDVLVNNGHSGHRLVLDLSEVSFLDADGVALFRELTAHHVLLTNFSLFAAEQLKEVVDVDR